MIDYILEIKNNNYIHEFSEYIGRKIDCYRFYDDHIIIELKRENIAFASANHRFSTFELYPYFVNVHNSSIHKSGEFTEKEVIILEKMWRKFLTKKFKNYKEDLENAINIKNQTSEV